MIETSLKPCPFCGSNDIATEEEYSSDTGYSFGGHIVICNDCEMQTKHYETQEEAVKAWNKRATGQLEAKHLESFLQIFQEVKNTFCSHRECGHFSCTACINGCYGEECAFEAVEDALYELKEMENR